MKIFIRNQLTLDEVEALRAAWRASGEAARRYDFAPKSLQTEALAAAARDAEKRLHVLWRGHGWADRPTFEIGCALNNENII